MIDADLGVIATILRGMGFTMAFLGALFAFWARLQNDRHEKTKAWFEKKWDGISQSQWRTMPKRSSRPSFEERIGFQSLFFLI